jgi:hypothetical protein
MAWPFLLTQLWLLELLARAGTGAQGIQSHSNKGITDSSWLGKTQGLWRGLGRLTRLLFSVLEWGFSVLRLTFCVTLGKSLNLLVYYISLQAHLRNIWLGVVVHACNPRKTDV